MGRNAQKRRARRQKRIEEEQRERAQAQVQRVAAEELDEEVIAQPVWEEALSPDLTAVLNEAGLDRLLFHFAASLAAGTGPLSERLAPVARQIAHWIPADTVTLAVEERGELTAHARFARHEEDRDLLERVLDAELIKNATKVVRVADAPRDPRLSGLFGQRSHIGSLMAVPFSVSSFGDEGPRGVMLVTRKEARGFPDDAEHLLARLGIAIGRDLARVAELQKVFLCRVTGLRSRAALLTDLPLWIARARRRGETLSAILIEVRNLADIQREFGPDAEGVVIRELGERARNFARFSDAVTRFGRGSFVMIGETAEEEARAGAQRLFDLFSAPVKIGDVAVAIEARVGVAELGPDDDGFELLAAAEVDMFSPVPATGA